jgi:flagellar biogenesis protein FliO
LTETVATMAMMAGWMRRSGFWFTLVLALAVCASAQESSVPTEPAAPVESVEEASFGETTPPPVVLYGSDESEGSEEPSGGTGPASDGGARPAESAEDEAASQDAAPNAPSDDPLLAATRAIMSGETDAESGADGDAPGGKYTSQTRGMLYKAARTMAALLFVLALILLVSFFVKKKGKGIPLLAGSHLGSVMGKVRLSQRATLHFVRCGGRVLVVGVTPNDISMIAEFDETAFDMDDEEQASALGAGADSAVGFLAQLKSNMAQMKQNDEAESENAGVGEDADIASLKGEIHRLQEYLREPPSDSSE